MPAEGCDFDLRRDGTVEITHHGRRATVLRGARAEEAAGGFFDELTHASFSAGDELKVTGEQRQGAIRMCHQSDQTAALGCMAAFGTTDFRARI